MMPFRIVFQMRRRRKYAARTTGTIGLLTAIERKLLQMIGPTMTLIPEDPDERLTRNALANALAAAGFPVKPATLATKATRGGGPPFRRFGARPLYRWGDAIAWAESRLSSLHRSTSEYSPGTTVGRTDPHENMATKLPGEKRPGISAVSSSDKERPI